MAENQKNYSRMPLGEILVDMGCISQQQWEAALSMAGRRGCAFQDVLIEGGLISEDDVTAALALQQDLRTLSWNRIKRIVSMHELYRVKPDSAAPQVEHLVWSKRGGPTLVLIHQAVDVSTRNQLKAAYGQRRVQVCLATQATFAEAAAKTRVLSEGDASTPSVNELIGGTAEVEAPPPVETGEFGLPDSSDAAESDPFSEDEEAETGVNASDSGGAGPDAPVVGTEVVDGYRILKELASGAVGAVYLAERTDDKTRVAIKRLHAHLASNQKTVAQFAAERHLLQRFSHPNIITVYGGGQWDGRPYFAMELLPGASLGDAIKRGDVLPVPTIMWLWCQIADALAYAHRMGVLHRDIKPDNVLLAEGPNAKLVDFGIANAMRDDTPGTETAAGTPLYMAPEQLRGQPLCPATDIYALGMLAFQMLTGEILDGHLDMQAMIRRRQQRDISVDDIRRPLAKGLQARGQMTEIDASMMDFTRILHQSLRLNTKDRYRDAEELTKRLRILMRMRGWPTPPLIRLPPAQDIDWDAMATQGAPTPASVDAAMANAATVELPPASQPEQPRIPEDYEVVKDLGKGSMGEVYLARDRDNGRMVALKLIAPEMAANTRFRNRFQREAEVLGRLSHPAIVHIYGVQFEGPTPHIAMEYVSGQDLDSVLKAKKQLTVEESVGIIKEIADALKHVHAAGIIHRDLKPSNLMVTTHGEIKILDFGVAKDEEGADLTKTGAVIGTPHYMSPEQASGKPATPKSDMYALGMIWYQLLVGRVPFRGSIPQVLHQHVAIQPPRVSDSVPVPDAVDKMVARMLRKRAEERPESFDEIIRVAQSVTAPPPTFIGIWSSLKLAFANIVAGGLCLGAGVYGESVLPDTLIDWVKVIGVALLGLGGVNVVLNARARRQGK